jgi:short-subunit dehydrogenase
LREDELETLQINAGKNIDRLSTLTMDLTDAQAIDQLMKHLNEQSISVEVLINNAGTALYGPQIELNPVKVHNMLNLNVQVLTALASRIANHMIEKGIPGRILNVASIAAFAPVPNLAAYSASKHYVLAFSNALAQELKPYGIHVGSLCPGITKTPIFERMGLNPTSSNKTSVSFWTERVAMSVIPVATCAIHAIENKAAVALPGINRLVTVGRLIPGQHLSSLIFRIISNRESA